MYCNGWFFVKTILKRDLVNKGLLETKHSKLLEDVCGLDKEGNEDDVFGGYMVKSVSV